MKPGPKPSRRVSTTWSKKLAYAIGLITADGCLSKDGRHINLTSRDKAQIELFKKCLGLITKTGRKYSGSGNLAYQTQFGDVVLYRFLEKIGLTPAKSNTLSALNIPDKNFSDFVRGYFDGDGSSFSYFDPIYPLSYRFYISFTSGSLKYIKWLRFSLDRLLNIKGHISINKNNNYVQLKYSKKEAIIFSKFIYRHKKNLYLKRKYLKIKTSLSIINSSRGGEIGRRAAFRSQ